MFKVVGIDNYNREHISDMLAVIPQLHTQTAAQLIADVLNENSGPEPSTWYVVYPADKPLNVFEP